MSLELFSLPHAGGGASAFAAWRGCLGAAAITPTLWGEDLALLGGDASLEMLAALLGRRLERKIKGDFGLVGASAGGLVTLAVADWLCRREAGASLKFALIVSMPTKSALPHLDHMSTLDDRALFDALKALGGVPRDLALDATFFRPVLQRVRRELRLFQGQPLPSRRGSYPLYVCAGHLDQLVDWADLAALSATLGAECTMWPGDHFFWQQSTALPRLIFDLSRGWSQP